MRVTHAGHFRHRQIQSSTHVIGLARREETLEGSRAMLGVSLADELPVEILLGGIAARRMSRDVTEQVASLRELSEPLRGCLEHLFLLFSELSLCLGRLAHSFPELAAREQHRFRHAFLETTYRELTRALREIGAGIDTVQARSSPEQKRLFLNATRKRLAPFFESIPFPVGPDTPLLYPGGIDLREARKSQRFEGEEMLPALVTTLLVEGQAVESRLQLESRVAEALAVELARRQSEKMRRVSVFSVLYLSAGFGRVGEGFLARVEASASHAPEFEFVHIDFLEHPLLRTQATLQKITPASRGGPRLRVIFEQHVTSEAAQSPSEDLVLTLDLKRHADHFDVIVCPWLADYLSPASRMALFVKLRQALRTGGLCLVGKSPPPRALHDVWPFLLDWDLQTPELADALAGLPVGLSLETPPGDTSAASSSHWLFPLRRQNED